MNQVTVELYSKENFPPPTLTYQEVRTVFYSPRAYLYVPDIVALWPFSKPTGA